TFMTALGVPPEAFRGRSVLDVGCGSCEKATFYADWGARVVGIEMTPAVVARAREVVGGRDIRIVQGSLFDVDIAEQFDIVISDGVLHHTFNTKESLVRCAARVKRGGVLVFGLVNVWGRFWWFKLARAITRVLGSSDYHARARWGRRLFGRSR